MPDEISVRLPGSLAYHVPVLPFGDSTAADLTTGDGWRWTLTTRLRPPYFVDMVGPNRAAGSTRPDRDHAGYSGTFIQELEGFLATLLPNHKPRIIVIGCAGVNNVAVGETGLQSANRLTSLLATIYAYDPFIATVVGLIQFTGARGWEGEAADYNARIPGVCSTRTAAGQLVTYSDTHTGVTTDDDVHPDHTPSGYDLVAARFADTILGWDQALAILGDPR